MPPLTPSPGLYPTLSPGTLYQKEGAVVVASAGTPVPLADSLFKLQSVLIIPGKANRTANTGSVWIGFSEGEQVLELTPTDDPFAIEAPPNQKIDLSQIFVDATTNGDGVRILGIV